MTFKTHSTQLLEQFSNLLKSINYYICITVQITRDKLNIKPEIY